jgi:hypothetical protein
VSHFVDDATANGVVPETSPTVWSWITAPSAATIRIIPPPSPALRTRSSNAASVATNASGDNTRLTTAVVVAGTVALVVVGDDAAVREYARPRVARALDDAHPAILSPATTNAPTHTNVRRPHGHPLSATNH